MISRIYIVVGRIGGIYQYIDSYMYLHDDYSSGTYAVDVLHINDRQYLCL